MPILMVSAAWAMETDPNRAKETAAFTAILPKLFIDSSFNQWIVSFPCAFPDPDPACPAVDKVLSFLTGQ
ncbi:hypothetical protein JUNP479_2535 [Aeromonas jandaei]|nr:hypothetical protein JUNP479_2535 [Aeromonas jandaei]